VQDRAAQLARFAGSALARADAVLADIPAGERPRVYYGRGPEGLETGLAGSINMEVLAAVGATNVAELAGTGGHANVSVEQVLSWDPGVILTQNPVFRTLVLTDATWSEVAAVRAGRVFLVPSIPFGWFDAPSGINRLIGVAWLTSVLYPGAAAGDLRAEVRDFFSLFYHVDPTKAQIDGLLAGAPAGSH
jgi:iron complex transport system substrate-binding protein